jgi:hypothetical protein
MLPLITTLAVTTPVTPPDGTYHYALTLAGETLGKNSITVSRDAAGNVVLSETGSGNMNGQTGSVQDTFTLDSALAPSFYQSVASVADSRNMHTTLTFSGNQAKQSGDVTKTYTLTHDAKHFVMLDFVSFAGFFALPAQMQAWSNPPVCAIVPMYARLASITVDPSMKPDRPTTVPAGDVQISVAKPVQFTLWYDPKTLVVDELDAPTEGFTVKRAP